MNVLFSIFRLLGKKKKATLKKRQAKILPNALFCSTVEFKIIPYRVLLFLNYLP